MAQITVSNLTFCYDGSYDNVFENISFTLDTDWRLGFTGRNGRGKTTFLKLLMGEYSYSGSIASQVLFDYFPFTVPDKTLDTIAVVAQICPDFEQWRLEKELSLLAATDDLLYRPFETLSNGEQTKILLAALFMQDNRFLLIDEPTNHLDRDGRRLVSEYLRGKKGFILVSHDRSFLDGCIDHILSINKTNIEIQKGNFSSWSENKQRQDDFEIGQNEKLKKDIKRLSDAAKQTAQWSDATEKSKIGEHAADRGFIGHKAAKMMKRAKVTQSRQSKASEEKSKLLKNIEVAEDLKIHPLSYHTQRLITAEKLSIQYGGKPVLAGIDFAINQGDRIALTGKNGCGKSSVLKLLAGESVAFSGNLQAGSRLVISYVAQDTSFLQGDMKTFTDESGIDESLFKAILRKLDFSRVQFEKDMAELSGGQKKKILIAKSLCQQAHLYLWDEPLNFVDVLSRIQIENLLLEYKPTMLFVEHDAQFSDRICTGQINL